MFYSAGMFEVAAGKFINILLNYYVTTTATTVARPL